MEIKFEVPIMTPRIVAAIQEMTLAVADAATDTKTVQPTDNGKLVEWESIQRGKEVAKKLVEAWSEGWADDHSGNKVDRMALMASFKGNPDLYAYLKQNNESSKNLIAVGATEAMAANIITVGSVAGAWPIQTI